MSSTTSSVKANKMAKKTAPVTTTPAAAAPAPAPAATAAPAKEKKVKAVKAPASKAEVAVPTVAAVPATEEATPQGSLALLEALTAELRSEGARLDEISSKLRKAVKTALEVAKQAKKEQRDSKKKRKISPEEMTPEQRKAWEARRANNAFLVQRPLSPELCSFMGIAAGSKRSQTEVTKFISEYVKTHNCFDPSFKRRIVPNAALAKLLRVDDKTEVTYLNLQKYLKVHFQKA